MSEQITIATMDDMINSLSREAQVILIKIGLTWESFVGSSGSWVSRTSLIKLAEMNEPWSANKLTTKGQGRNGIIYSLVPLLKEYDLIRVIDGKNFTRYMLTETGKEIIRAMLFRCHQCNETRVCGKCNENLDIHNKPYPCSYTSHNIISECQHCDENGMRLCWSCNGKQNCQYCISYNR
jgi:hypothetical protein